MTVPITAQPDVLVEKHKTMSLHALKDENRLLFDQLQLVQEELERQHDQAQIQSQASNVVRPTTVIELAPVDERLIETHSENLRYQALVKAQEYVYNLQTRYALAGQLGTILIDGSRSAGAMLSIPARLHKAWRQNRQEIPPASLGGKSYDKVISVYQQGGEAAVETLLEQTSVSMSLQAGAWTALARTKLVVAPELAASMARRAFSLEPQPYRQKWLAFRLHEAGELLEAEALLTLLPVDTKFSESEERQIERLRRQAKNLRDEQAQAVYSHTEQHDKLQQRWQGLVRSRDELVTQLDQLRIQQLSSKREVEGLKKQSEEQERNAGVLQSRCESLQAELLAVGKAHDQQGILVTQERVRREAAEASIKDLQQQHKELKELATQWFEQSVALQAGVAQLTQQRENLERTLTQQKQRCEDLQSKVLSYQQVEKGQVADWQKQIGVLRSALDAAKHSQKEADTQLAAQLAQIETLQTELEFGEQVLTATRDERDAFERELHTVKQALDAHLQEFEPVKQELGNIKRERDLLEEQWIEQHEALEARIAEMSQIHHGLESQIQEERAKQDALQKELLDAVRRCDEQTSLAAQRQGELLHQARERHELEKVKMAQEVRQQELERLLAVQIQRESEQIKGLHEQMKMLVAQQPALEAAMMTQLKRQAEERLKQLLQEQQQSLKETKQALQVHQQALERVLSEQAGRDAKQMQALVAQQPALEAAVAALIKQQAQEQSEQWTRDWQRGLEESRRVLQGQYDELERLLVTQASRENEQIQGLSEKLQTLMSLQPALESAVTALLQKQAHEQAAKQINELHGMQRHIETVVKNSSANVARQVQSYIGMQEYLATGHLPAFNSESQSWPVSADFALFLMQRLVLEQYDLVLEFGSGMSTVVVAKTLAMVAERTHARAPVFVSFDHLDKYYQQTMAYLAQAGLNEQVELVLAPLKAWKGLNGQTQPYYDCGRTLDRLARNRDLDIKRILVIVDGPPASTGPQARYPAGPVIVKRFPNVHIDFLLDDYIRADEKEVAQRWLAEMGLTDQPDVLTEYKFEKDACLITVHSKDKK